VTFLLVERLRGSVDAVDEPTESFIRIECDLGGASYGTITEDEGPMKSATCEYRQGGLDSSQWTFWDSLMVLNGQTPATQGAGFSFATFG
jgi:hypothetical protein